MVKIDPKVVASATKVVVGVVLVSAGMALKNKGLKELGGKLIHSS